MKNNKEKSKMKLILRIFGVVFAISLIMANIDLIFGLLTAVLPIATTGVVTLAGLNAYWDSGCTNEVTSISWGSMYPGSSKNVTIYLKNTGNVPITLSLTTDSWNPSNAETYFTLTWDYSGGQIQPDEVLQITLTLTVSGDVQGITNFSFNVVITGTEVT